jgi:uncharacterized protein (DUF302 family)/uncharacterized membrane protein YidH (DUF202 family)
MNDPPIPDPNLFLAVERTALAWVRTGLALMGFGFVVARFGIFLEQLAAVRATPAKHAPGISVGLGILLVACGVVVCLATARRYVLQVRSLERGQRLLTGVSRLAVVLSGSLAAIGLGIVIYLMLAQRATSSQPQGGLNMELRRNSGIVTRRSAHSVEETVTRLRRLLEERKITLFAVVDHGGEAQKAGLKMPPAQLLIFGDPKSGTPVMLAAPTCAIDLPLKMLVSEDAEGRTWISYNDPKYLQERHQFPEELIRKLAVAEVLSGQVAK